MVLGKKLYEGLLSSTLQDSWSRLDYEGDLLNLRIVGAKAIDAPVRVYFDTNREQVVSGLRYAPVAGGEITLYGGSSYRLDTHVEFVKPMPNNRYGLIYPFDGLAEAGMSIMSGPILPGFKGVVQITVLMTNSMKLIEMCWIARLMVIGEKPTAKKKPPKSSKTAKAKPKEGEEPKDEASDKTEQAS